MKVEGISPSQWQRKSKNTSAGGGVQGFKCTRFDRPKTVGNICMEQRANVERLQQKEPADTQKAFELQSRVGIA